MTRVNNMVSDGRGSAFNTFQQCILRQGFRLSLVLNLFIIFHQISGSCSYKVVNRKRVHINEIINSGCTKVTTTCFSFFYCSCIQSSPPPNFSTNELPFGYAYALQTIESRPSYKSVLRKFASNKKVQEFRLWEKI